MLENNPHYTTLLEIEDLKPGSWLNYEIYWVLDGFGPPGNEINWVDGKLWERTP